MKDSPNRVIAFFEWLWFEYLIFTALYMLGSRERIAFTSCLVAFLATACYSSYVFLPHYLGSLLHYLGYTAGQNWEFGNHL